VKQEHKKMMNTILPYLIRVHRLPHLSVLIKQFSQQLETCLHEQYIAPISYLDIHRTQEERELVQSMQYRLKQSNHILRVTDKSGIFHIGYAADYEKKAEAYRQKTQAYIELASDPLWAVFDKVVHLLNDLRSKKQIFVWHLNKMMPKRDKVALAYL
jgi:hypothetical protein